VTQATQATDRDRSRLVEALSALWHSEPAVQKHHLQFDAARIKHLHGGWVVPVTTPDENGEAWELVKAISSLEESAERKTQLSVTLMLDPGFPD
jgi:hypothetical protein